MHLHGLVFETSIYSWQDQPGKSQEHEFSVFSIVARQLPNALPCAFPRRSPCLPFVVVARAAAGDVPRASRCRNSLSPTLVSPDSLHLRTGGDLPFASCLPACLSPTCCLSSSISFGVAQRGSARLSPDESRRRSAPAFASPRRLGFCFFRFVFDSVELDRSSVRLSLLDTSLVCRPFFDAGFAPTNRFADAARCLRARGSVCHRERMLSRAQRGRKKQAPCHDHNRLSATCLAGFPSSFFGLCSASCPSPVDRFFLRLPIYVAGHRSRVGGVFRTFLL